ncbi:MAG TPA: valine--tRNA ligase, partial [Bacteroidales bacterium]|nr:valine--tRNA ligase [Bacteroidales bacterium]
LVDEPDKYITIATTRPETILGDTAICVNPTDERYKNIIGKKVKVPIINRIVDIIADEYVDPTFGTGALKITPAHDINDYNIGLKYNLHSIDIFNEDATLNENAKHYVGKDRFEARELIIKDLIQQNLLEKIEDYINKIGFSERTDAIIEPRLSLQWFLKMQELAKPALDVVLNDTVKFHPPKFKNTYKYWMENVKDWCISRQLWWGHRIPAWYLPDGQYVVAVNENEALNLAKQINGFHNIKLNDLKQDEDVLDTWFSSWIWPISVFDGIRNPDNEEIKYYYPTNDLVTAPEILFFWVARMIMAGLEYRKEIPFKNVYFTGIVRDKKGRKMSKSLGNSPEPLELIAKYGADGVRAGMLLTSPAGNDLPFDESLCEQGRNFSNKIWNALRLIKSWKTEEKQTPDTSIIAIKWFKSKISEEIITINDHFQKYRISDALMAVYKLIWDEFCSWYLEMIKPPYGETIDNTTYNETIIFFEKLIKLLHPFMPFITEEIYQNLISRKTGDFIMISKWPEAETIDKTILNDFNIANKIITAIRTHRKENNISFKEKITLYTNSNKNQFESIIIKLCNLSEIIYTKKRLENAYTFVIQNSEFFIPVNENYFNKKIEITKIEKEISYLKSFLETVEKKLTNQKFIENAPSNVIENEKKKKIDIINKIKILQENLERLQK